MTTHFETRRRPSPGGATVADIRALDHTHALAILMFRDWFDGAQGRARVAGVFADALGPAAGQAAFETWSDCLTELSGHARRPLMRHGLGCTCVGADEAVFAQTIVTAATAEREDSMLVLALLVPGDRLTIVHHLAGRAGLAVLRAAGRLHAPRPPSTAMH